MCLVKTHRFPKISRKPITVCKRFVELYNGQLRTPYIGTCCQCNDIIKASKPWYKGVFKDTIDGEGVHAYVFDEWYYHWNRSVFHFDDIYYYACIIPPFTPYWIGQNDEICASKMKIIKRL